MPPWMRRLFGFPDPPPLWQPVYQPQQFVSEPNNSGGTSQQPINLQYLLSKESAFFLAGLYGANVVELLFEGAGGPVTSNAIEYILVWPDGLRMNGGFLAYYYKPADGPSAPATVDNPDIAVTECKAAINAARLDMQRKTR